MIDKIIAVVSENFPNGVRADFITENKIRQAYRKKYPGEKIPVDFSLRNFIREKALEHDGKFYFLDATIKNQVLELANSLLTEINPIIFYESFYLKHRETLNKLKIFSTDILILTLKSTTDKIFFAEKFFARDSQITLIKALEQILKSTPPLSEQELQNILLYVPKEELHQALSDSKFFVPTISKKFLPTELLHFDLKEISGAREKILADVKTCEQAIFNEQLFKKNIAANPIISDKVLCEALYSIFFADDFSRNGDIVTVKGRSLGLKYLLKQFCNSRDKISMKELRARAREIKPRLQSSTGSLKAVLEVMTRVSQDLFVKDSLVKFDVEGTDKALSTFVQGKIIPLRAVNSFAAFPPVENYTWNLYLLESFLRKFSRQFSFYATEINSSLTGAICPRQKSFKDYVEVQAAVIAQENIPLNIEDIDTFLIDNGYRMKHLKDVSEEIILLAKDILTEGAD